VYWQVDQQAKRKPGRLRKNWIDVIQHDLRQLVWHGKMLNSLQQTAKAGVVVWPNVSTTRDDPSLSLSYTKNMVGFLGISRVSEPWPVCYLSCLDTSVLDNTGNC